MWNFSCSESTIFNCYFSCTFSSKCTCFSQLQDGLLRFSNSLRLNLQKPLPSSVQIPSTVHISCMPRRWVFLFSFLNLHYCSSFKAIDSNTGCFRTYLRAAAPEGGRIFYIRAMNRKYGCNGTFNWWDTIQGFILFIFLFTICFIMIFVNQNELKI